MAYEDLVKSSWRTGDYVVDYLAQAAKHLVSTALYGRRSTRSDVKTEMETIVKREDWDANSCLTAHKEGIMKLAPFVKFREEKFGAVLFETRSEKVYTLSPTGAAVVREVIAGADAKTAVLNLKAKYEDKSGTMEREALAFIASLKEKGLVTE